MAYKLIITPQTEYDIENAVVWHVGIFSPTGKFFNTDVKNRMV
jgi:hypothetical protein